MPPEENLNEAQSTYVIDAENAAEMARLISQSQLITKTMGSLFPEELDPSSIHDVLDIGCGPGGWVLDVALAYPEMNVQGIDISELMVEFARSLAQEQGLNNASFQIMNALEPLRFPDSSFDFVNARLIGAFMTDATWPKLIQECWRIVRPKGSMRLTECDFTRTNSPSYEMFMKMFGRAMQLSKQYFLQGEQHSNITSILSRFLRDVGFQLFEAGKYVIDLSAQAEAHTALYQDSKTFLKLIQPFLIKMEVTTPEEADTLYQRAMADMQADNFQGTWDYHSVWGQKSLQ